MVEVEAARRNKRVVQVGTQQRSGKTLGSGSTAGEVINTSAGQTKMLPLRQRSLARNGLTHNGKQRYLF